MISFLKKIKNNRPSYIILEMYIYNKIVGFLVLIKLCFKGDDKHKIQESDWLTLGEASNELEKPHTSPVSSYCST